MRSVHPKGNSSSCEFFFGSVSFFFGSFSKQELGLGSGLSPTVAHAARALMASVLGVPGLD